jgi:hypothetical protein
LFLKTAVNAFVVVKVFKHAYEHSELIPFVKFLVVLLVALQ